MEQFSREHLRLVGQKIDREMQKKAIALRDEKLRLRKMTRKAANLRQAGYSDEIIARAFQITIDDVNDLFDGGDTL